MKTILSGTAIFVLLLLSSCQQPGAPIQQHNNIRLYLSQVAEEISDSRLSGITSVEQWEKMRPRRYDEFIEMMGIQDYMDTEKSELNVTLTDTVQENGYRIEKLWYESLPGLYVPANLYIPDNLEGPAPAILYVCGHAPGQKVHYQSYPRKFAEMGFICLIIETIQFGEVWGVHHGCYSRGWFHWYSRGYNPAGVELWNAIRGLDLLAAHPEVDAEKLGVTGISGGGSQTFYIAAADRRIKAAASLCGATTLKDQVGLRLIDDHCDCMLPTNTRMIDFHDIGALIAPVPFMIAQSDHDMHNTVESVRELHAGIRPVYEMYGVPENLRYVETPGPHAYHRISRQQIQAFFMEHLKGINVSPEETGDIELTRENFRTEEELRVFTSGIPEDDRTTTIQDSFIKLPAPPEINTEAELVNFRTRVKDFLADRTFGAFPKEAIPFRPEMEFKGMDSRLWNTWRFDSEPGWRLRVRMGMTGDPARRKPLMIVLRCYDEDRGAAERFISGLDTAWNVAFLETRGTGEFGWAPDQNWHVRRAAAWTGRTVASMQVYDVLRCIEFCRTLDNVDPDHIGIAGRNDMAVVALYAALMDGNCSEVILGNPPATQDAPSQPDGRGPTIEMLNCLRITDVYQIPALLHPAGITFSGEIPETYRWSEEILLKLGGKGFRFY